MPGSNSSIVVTDWGDTHRKHINANYRGVETDELIKIHKQISHLMICGHTEVAGGYAIYFDYRGVQKELEYRKALPEGY